MASAVVSESPDPSRIQPRLSLHVDTPPSSSPFPSPSSSFLPPPMPGAHEFAVKPPPPGKGKRGGKADTSVTTSPVVERVKEREAEKLGADRDESKGLSSATPTPTNQSTFLASGNGNEEPYSNLATSPQSTISEQSTPIMTPTDAISADPLNMALEASTSSPTSHEITSSSSVSPPKRSSTQESSTSLTSNRPAPPSPAISRRASTAPSTASNRSRSSRPSSTSIHHTHSLSRTSTQRKSTQLSQTTPPQKKRRSLLVKIKDFAFNRDDDRYKGMGTDVPKPNRVNVLNRFHRSSTSSHRLSISSIGTSSSDGAEAEEDDGDGWNGFKFGLSRLSWGFGAGVGAVTFGGGAGSKETPRDFPSNTDFARNFADEGDEDEDDDPEDAEEEVEEPLYSGLYRALYAFEPEGTAEMKLEEDQVVRVIGRGGGVGWAVVDKGDGKGHALVPESYLEVVQLDEEEEECESPIQ